MTMPRLRFAIVTVLVGAFALSPLHAQQSIVDDALLDEAVAARAAETDDQRDAIAQLLEREQVRDIAARAGISLADVRAAAATLDGDELADVAAQAEQVDDSLSGDQSTITLWTTTIIIGLLVLILIIVAV
jgi:hypothetical protein